MGQIDRATHHLNPCLDDCQSDPAKGALRITDVKRTPSGPSANARANSQVVVITNTGKRPILLDEYYVRRQLSTFSFAPGTVFLFFTGMMALHLLWVVFMVPETKGVPLEELEEKLGA